MTRDLQPLHPEPLLKNLSLSISALVTLSLIAGCAGEISSDSADLEDVGTQSSALAYCSILPTMTEMTGKIVNSNTLQLTMHYSNPNAASCTEGIRFQVVSTLAGHEGEVNDEGTSAATLQGNATGTHKLSLPIYGYYIPFRAVACYNDGISASCQTVKCKYEGVGFKCTST
jgi:hypothetical protein